MSVSRGAVWWAAIPDLGNRPVLIVSAQALNRALHEVTVARITAVDRERAIPTFVVLEAGEVLPERSFVICQPLHAADQRAGRLCRDADPDRLDDARVDQPPGHLLDLTDAGRRGPT